MNPQDEQDIVAINTILDRLRRPARLGTLAGEAQHTVSVCRLQIAATRDNLRGALRECRPELVREVADAVLTEIDRRLTALAEDLTLADPADTTNRLASLWKRQPNIGTPLGAVELPDGQRIDVADELHADALVHEAYESFVREADATRRRAIKQSLKDLLDLMQPGERGARVEGSNEAWPRLGVDPQIALAVDADLGALLAQRPDHGQTLPDVWGASGVDTPGFRNMAPSEICARLIARRLGLVPETGWERVRALARSHRPPTGIPN
jgi:hypothetical protein